MVNFRCFLFKTNVFPSYVVARIERPGVTELKLDVALAGAAGKSYFLSTSLNSGNSMFAPESARIVELGLRISDLESLA